MHPFLYREKIAGSEREKDALNAISIPLTEEMIESLTTPLNTASTTREISTTVEMGLGVSLFRTVVANVPPVGNNVEGFEILDCRGIKRMGTSYDFGTFVRMHYGQRVVSGEMRLTYSDHVSAPREFSSREANRIFGQNPYFAPYFFELIEIIATDIGYFSGIDPNIMIYMEDRFGPKQ